MWHPATSGADSMPVRRPRLLRVALVCGAAVGMADATLVAVAMGPMAAHFRVPLAAAAPVISLYLVTVTATMPVIGRLGDRFGRRSLYLCGFAVFAAGSLVAALAPGLGVLLAGRVVQALGGGMLTSGSLALVATWAPRRGAGRAIAVLVVAQAVAGLVAPPLGGALVAIFDWQAVFWVGLPVAAAGSLLTLVAVPATGPSERLGRPLDLAGSLGLGLLLLGAGLGIASIGGDVVAGAPSMVWFLVAGGGALILAAFEWRATHPVIDAALLRGRFGGAALATFLSTGSLMSCFALLPFWLESAHGASPALAGAALLPAGVGIAATSRLAGRHADLGRTRVVTVAGMAVAATGVATAALAALLDSWWLLAAGLFVLGCGNGLFSSPNTAAAMGVAPRSGLGGAAGLLSTARNAGVICGLGAAGAVYTMSTRGGGGGRADAAAAAIQLAAALLCVVVAAIAHRTYRRPHDPGQHGPAAPE